MTKLSSFKPSPTHRVLVYGESKSGKTQLAGALSSFKKLLWFDLENGWETLLKLPTNQQENIDLIAIPDTKVFPIAIETMLKVVTGSKVDICAKHGKVSCPMCKKDQLEFSTACLADLETDLEAGTIVVIDSLTQLANSAMNHITKGQPDDYKLDWDDYRKQGHLMDKLLSQIQQAKYNIICLTHVVETEMDDGKKKLVPAAGTTSFSRNTAKYFDHVIYLDVRNKKHNAASATTYSNTVLTGSRTDFDISVKEQPSLEDIFRGNAVSNASNAPESRAAANLRAMLKPKSGS